MEITRGFRDRIQRAGGMVLVTAVGAISITAASGQAATMTANGGSVAVTAAGAITANTASGQEININAVGALGNLKRDGATQAYWNTGGFVVVNTLTVSGTGTHSFSGPVKVSSSTTPRFEVDLTTTGGFDTWYSRRSGAKRYSFGTASNDDTVFYTYTGAAGAEVPTESFRLLNASGYLQVATRLGIGTSPAYSLHVVGTTYLSSSTNHGVEVYTSLATAHAGYFEKKTNAGSGSAGFFYMNIASATSPVVVVKLGATPGAGADAVQVQNSLGTVIGRWQDSGAILTQNNAGFRSVTTGASNQTLLVLDNTDQVNVGNTTLVTNLQASNWGYTVDAGATVAGYVTAKINGVDRKLMVAA